MRSTPNPQTDLAGATANRIYDVADSMAKLGDTMNCLGNVDPQSLLLFSERAQQLHDGAGALAMSVEAAIEDARLENTVRNLFAATYHYARRINPAPFSSSALHNFLAQYFTFTNIKKGTHFNELFEMTRKGIAEELALNGTVVVWKLFGGPRNRRYQMIVEGEEGAAGQVGTAVAPRQLRPQPRGRQVEREPGEGLAPLFNQYLGALFHEVNQPTHYACMRQLTDAGLSKEQAKDFLKRAKGQKILRDTRQRGYKCYFLVPPQSSGTAPSKSTSK
jgi:hypothetical protein